MTNTVGTPTRVDQFVHRVTPIGTATLLGSSVPLEHEAGWDRAIEEQLRPLRLESAPGALAHVRITPAVTAVARSTDSGQGAVIVHTVIAPDHVLTARRAVTMGSWPYWQQRAPARHRLERARPEDLDHPGRDLRSAALAQDEHLARILAWLLQAPVRPLGLVGCTPAGREGLLWGLMQLTEGQVEGRHWTFSTADVHPDHIDDPLLPEVVFLPTTPGEVSRRRTVVDLTQDQGASPENEYQANALVYRFEFGIDVTPDHPSAVASLPTAPVPVVRPDPARNAGGPPAPLPAADLCGIVDVFVNARSAVELGRGLGGIETHVRRFPDDRAAVRVTLARASWGVEAVEELLADGDRERTLERVVRAAFGDTLDAIDDAREVVETADSDLLVRAIVRLAAGTGRIDAVESAIARRWLHRPAEVAPPADDGLLAAALGRVGLSLSPQQERLLVAVLLIVLMVTSFVLGTAVGGPSTPGAVSVGTVIP